MMTCSGTEYSHEFFFVCFFYTRNVSNFGLCWFGFVFYSGCYYWGLKLTGTAVPLCSASNKRRKTLCLYTFFDKATMVIPIIKERRKKRDFLLARVKQDILMVSINPLTFTPKKKTNSVYLTFYFTYNIYIYLFFMPGYHRTVLQCVFRLFWHFLFSWPLPKSA